MSLRILEPGLCTLLVDHGRPGSRSLGVPVGGPADRFSLDLGNALVGNPPDAAALEICLIGPTVQADTALACVLCGAPFEISGKRRVGKTFTLPPGETLHIGGTPLGMRAYLCVRGGFQVPPVLGSHSGLQPLRQGQELPCLAGTIAARFIQMPPLSDAVTTLRVLPGAQADWFHLDTLYTEAFTVTPASNRMGLRLEGGVLRSVSVAMPIREMVSEPVCPGAVQVTRNGQCIILGVDGQTIGGYPKVAHVVSADQDVLGQLRPGQQLRFQAVTLPEAEILQRNRLAELREWLVRLRVSLP